MAALVYQVGERRSDWSVCRGFSEEAGSDEFSVVLDGIEMDMEARVGGEVLELLCEADEGFPMTQLHGEQFIECGQE